MYTNPYSTPATTQAVVVPKRSAHGFHMTMCLLTLGAWLPVWGICAILNAGKTRTTWVTR